MSDGGLTPDELGKLYASAGFDFLCLTDHWVCSDMEQHPDPQPLLWIDGVELDGKDMNGSFYHVVCIGKVSALNKDMGLPNALVAARAQGAILILAHPFWTNNSFEDALCHNFDGVETYNHICQWLNGKGDGGVHWNAMLRRNPATLGLAVDDTHLRAEHPGWNGGWIQVNAGRCDREAILQAIRSGRFYSSTGPAIEYIIQQDNLVQVQCSPVQFARLVGPGVRGLRLGSFDGSLMTSFSFDIPPDWSYAYVEIEDAYGRKAWTNSLLIPDWMA